MSIAAVSSNLIHQQSPGYFQQRRVDLRQLSKDLQSGDLAAAQEHFNAMQALAQDGPFGNGNAFKVSERQQDFAAIGEALEAGDLEAAQQAMAQLQATFHHKPVAPPPSPVGGLDETTTGPEIILNLGNAPAGEQITIGLSPTKDGGEKITVSLANQSQSPEQITINVKQGSNQQIILNLFSSDATATPGSEVNLSA